MELIDKKDLLEKVWDADTRCGFVQVVDRADIEDAHVVAAVPLNELYVIRREIAAYKVDHDQSDEYNEGFDDGVGYALDIIDEYIQKYVEGEE